ncbi:hypothetical protein [Aquimarina aquimarini]|uniref:hypothetical protein n=1 Tax=Aquimarina aquimarini TaxID=1191734 RepID=UPI001F3A23E2|nr:hypothetical protein [Aquimarina aquimarini]
MKTNKKRKIELKKIEIAKLTDSSLSRMKGGRMMIDSSDCSGTLISLDIGIYRNCLK